MIKNTKIHAVVLLALLIWGCDTEGLYEATFAVGPKATLNGGVAMHESGLDRIVYLDTAPTMRELYRLADGESLVWLKPGPNLDNPEELFALTVPLDERDGTLTESLLHIKVDGTAPVRYQLGSRFDNLKFGPHNRYAILFHGKNDNKNRLHNPNEVALIDLKKKYTKNRNPLILSVNLEGRRLQDVTFLGTVLVSGEEKELAVFFADGAVRIVDLENPAQKAVTMELTLSATQSATPVQVHSRDASGERPAMIFVRATGVEDIYQIYLSTSLDQQTGLQTLSASLNTFWIDGTPYDMVLVEDDKPLLAVVADVSYASGGTVLKIFDVDTSADSTIEVQDFVRNALLRQTDDKEEIVLYGQGCQGIYFVQVDGLSQETWKNLGDVKIPGSIGSVTTLDEDRLLITPQGENDLILFNMETRKSTRVTAPGLESVNTAQIVENKVFFASENSGKVNVLDLASGHPFSLFFDDRITSMHLLKGPKMGVVLHDSPSGRATVFPLNEPTRANAKVIDGMWFDGFLDEEEVPK